MRRSNTRPAWSLATLVPALLLAGCTKTIVDLPFGTNEPPEEEPSSVPTAGQIPDRMTISGRNGSGSCDLPADFTTEDVEVDAEESGGTTTITIRSNADVQGPLDQQTGDWQGEGTATVSDPETGSTFMLIERIVATWVVENGQVVARGELTLELSGGAGTCTFAWPDWEAIGGSA